MCLEKQGFMLVEILITVTLLSILLTASFLVAPPLIDKAFDGRRKADLQKIQAYLESFYSDAERYPSALPSCGQPFIYKDNVILPKFPCDPVKKIPYFYQINEGSPQSYRIYTMLANEIDPSIEKVGCLGGCGPDCSYNYGVSSTNVKLTTCSYVCAPSNNPRCEKYNDPARSECPKEYSKDPTCNNECGDPDNRCKNASGKNVTD